MRLQKPETRAPELRNSSHVVPVKRSSQNFIRESYRSVGPFASRNGPAAQSPRLAHPRIPWVTAPMIPDEKQLVAAARTGDEAAFNELMTAHGREIRSYLYRMVRQANA